MIFIFYDNEIKYNAFNVIGVLIFFLMNNGPLFTKA